MTKEEISAELPSTTDCPYVEVGSVVPNLESTGPQIKRLKTEDLLGVHFWLSRIDSLVYTIIIIIVVPVKTKR